MGLGKGYLKEVFAGNSDLVFGMLCEELGLLLALSIIACLALFVIYTLSRCYPKPFDLLLHLFLRGCRDASVPSLCQCFPARRTCSP